MSRFLAITMISIFLSACTATTPIPVSTPTIFSSTSTPPFTATATKTSLSTETPEPTLTPLPNLTFEDWKAILSGPYVGDNGLNYPDRWIFFSDKYSIIFSDAEQIRQMPDGTPFIVYNPDGSAVSTRNASSAADMVDNGSWAVASKTTSIELQLKATLREMNAEYLAGNNCFSLTIDNSVPSGIITGVALNFGDYLAT